MSDRAPSERFLASVSYDPVTGIFTRIKSRVPSTIGTPIQRRHGKDNYIIVSVGRERYYGHRLAWFFVHGRWPNPTVDHKNCDGSDNRIENLREATQSLNSANRRPPGPYKKGVTRRRNGFAAQIKVKGENLRLGTYRTEDEAHAAYRVAAERAFGEFARFHE